MPNHLSGQTSPYLLQHADNPVEWFPWGDEAFGEARAQNKPIFLSIGYSACHWCHVMAHESFEDERIARLLNEHFISIKVDREQRPEVDRVYMEAVQTMTGRGGWPLSVFLTPSRKPFFGGTYWPPRAQHGMPGFDQVLQAIAQAWRQQREALVGQAEGLTERLVASGEARELGQLDRAQLESAQAALVRQFDPECGGFGPAPKFPAPLLLRFLLRRWHADGASPLPATVATTLDRMAAGGIYDQLGGGFHRYSTDPHWLVPHFEKMLYDNALLATAYLEAWQASGNPSYRQVVEETLDYVLREMTDDRGGFYGSQDADTDGHEGTFYLWTPEEVYRTLGSPAADTFCEFYDVTEEGHFEGRNILHRSTTLDRLAESTGRDRHLLESELTESRRKLLAVRQSRRSPERDDKILVGWNGLMIDAMARAGAALGQARYLDAAARAADFVLDELRDGSGRLHHCWYEGQAMLDAYLDDYAAMVEALVTLYETRFERRWLDEAVRLADQILTQFADRSGGGFFFTASDHETIIVRGRDMDDSSVPSGGGLATMGLLRLAKLGRREDYWQVARHALRSQADALSRYPPAAGQMLLALEFYLGPTSEIAVVGGDDPADDREILAELHRRFIPNKVVGYVDKASVGSASTPKILEGKTPIAPGPTVYVCQDTTCQAPTVGREAARQAWDRLAGATPET
ncbi:MAG: thioredoxin domain-containing protein [Pirellulales bacterium]|nr:thioredoxin domain-containing protein [Pirellulales bacterium]